MRVLVACEYSGAVRDAFSALGHDATSCDLLDSESPGRHYKGDVRDILGDSWDLLVAHPPCTYLTNSGVRWLHSDASRWPKLFDGAAFFRLFDQAKHIPRRAIENPIPHRYARELMGRAHDQVIQPWQFGHGETKATCLWLTGLPALKPTNIVSGRHGACHKTPPSADRWKIRSRTYAGIAAAMAAQWGVCHNEVAHPRAGENNQTKKGE